MAGRSPFTVLGVSPWASRPELQRAYRDLARTLHPDHLPPGTSRDDVERRAARLREVTAAWARLRDPVGRREARDEWLAEHPGSLPEPSWTAAASEQHGGTDRRLPNAVVRPRASESPPSAVRWPVVLGVAALGVLGIIFVATAYLGRGSPAPSPDPSDPAATQPCVRVLPGPSVVAVRCDEPNDGRLVAHAATAAGCPAGSVARRLDPSDTGISCLEPTGGEVLGRGASGGATTSASGGG